MKVANDTQAVSLPVALAEAIRRHAAETYPNECCGALFGDSHAITDILRLPNLTSEGPRNRFLVLPADYQAAEEHATVNGVELAGFYHSHPDHPARPSQYDLDHAWPFFVYAIVSVKKGESGDLTAWRLREDRSAFEATPLHIEN